MKWIFLRSPLLAAFALALTSTAALGVPSGQGVGEWLIHTWETEDGLPENSATAMVQDSDGYIWFGTFKGLVRFDGVAFRVFDRVNTPELPSEGIVNLHLDNIGRLWVSTLAGLVVRKGADWTPVGRSEIGPNDYIRTFTTRQNGDLLLTTFHGRVFEFANDRLTQLPEPPGASGFGYLGGVDESGTWWVAQSKFVGKWSGNRWESMIAARELETAGAATVGLAAAQGGGLWLLVGSELRRFSQGAEVGRRRLAEWAGNHWSMTEDSRSNVWICTSDKGVVQIPPDEGMVRWNEQRGVSYHGVRFVFEDREKNLWVGTSGGGLQRFKRRRLHNFGPENGLTERVVKSVAPASDGGVWIATYGKGLFRSTEAGVTNVPLAGWTNKNLYAQSVLMDRSGRTWVGTFAEGLFRLDENGTRRFPSEQTGGNNIIALFEDSRGRVWMSGGEGVSMFEAETFQGCGTQSGAAISGVCCFGEDKDGAIWLSNLEEVYRFDRERFVKVDDPQGNLLKGITCFKPEPDGSMWMGSLGSGLLRWRERVVTRLGAQAGLPVQNIHAILEDSQGFFWMPSNRGVMRARRGDLKSVAEGTAARLVVQLLGLSDGLGGMECPSGQQPVCARDSQGRLWFATSKGVAFADPALFRANTVVPTVKVEEVVYHGPNRGAANSDTRRVAVSPPFPEPLRLPAGSRGVEIHFSAPSFASPEKVAFRVDLDGQALDWSEAANRRVTYIDELEPGWHTFHVQAANDDGLWNLEGASLSLSVLPFFWQTAWFDSLAAGVLCGAGWIWVYRHRANLQLKRAAQEAFTRQLILSQENERKRVAAELHDGLGQDLLLIKNRLALLTPTTNPEVARQLQEVSTTASRTIADVRAISHALRPSALEQVGLTKAMEWMIEQVAEASGSKFSSELENIDHLLPPEAEINLYRIVQEGLNNVIKHAQASEVIIEARKEPQAISVSVFDNGAGFDPENLDHNGQRKPSFGLTSMAERAKVIGGRLEIKSTSGTGTRITLHVPIPKPNH